MHVTTSLWEETGSSRTLENEEKSRKVWYKQKEGPPFQMRSQFWKRFSSAEAVLLMCCAPWQRTQWQHSGLNRVIYRCCLMVHGWLCLRCPSSCRESLSRNANTKGELTASARLCKPRGTNGCDRWGFNAHLCLHPLVSVLHLYAEGKGQSSSPAVIILSFPELCWLLRKVHLCVLFSFYVWEDIGSKWSKWQ